MKEVVSDGRRNSLGSASCLIFCWVHNLCSVGQSVNTIAVLLPMAPLRLLICSLCPAWSIYFCANDPDSQALSLLPGCKSGTTYFIGPTGVKGLVPAVLTACSTALSLSFSLSNRFEIVDVAGSTWATEATDCDGSESTNFANTYCLIPMDILWQPPAPAEAVMAVGTPYKSCAFCISGTGGLDSGGVSSMKYSLSLVGS